MSRALPYWHVDAFTDRAFGGNQAAVMEVDDTMAGADKTHDHCKLIQFDPQPRDENFNQYKRTPDYFL